MFTDGSLVTEDVEFLREVGLLDEATQKSVVYELTDAMKLRLIKNMPLAEVKKELAKMSYAQICEVADYAVVNYRDLVMDRIDLLSEMSGKKIMEAIKNYKAAQEG
jgi:Mg/Co/Ni transporter MgtE